MDLARINCAHDDPQVWKAMIAHVREASATAGRECRIAMGARAECVMLNKGPHIVDAVITLDDILCRMSADHDKKNALMRPLRSWRLPTVARSAAENPTPTAVALAHHTREACR